jgi:hypothetical protein
MTRLPSNFVIHEEEPLPDKVKELLALTGCKAAWSETVGVWIIYELAPKGNLGLALSAPNFEIISGKCHNGGKPSRWADWVAAVEGIRRVHRHV